MARLRFSMQFSVNGVLQVRLPKGKTTYRRFSFVLEIICKISKVT